MISFGVPSPFVVFRVISIHFESIVHVSESLVCLEPWDWAEIRVSVLVLVFSKVTQHNLSLIISKPCVKVRSLIWILLKSCEWGRHAVYSSPMGHHKIANPCVRVWFSLFAEPHMHPFIDLRISLESWREWFRESFKDLLFVLNILNIFDSFW
jgi:hypothetical protein